MKFITTCFALILTSAPAFAQDAQRKSIYLEQSFETLAAKSKSERFASGGILLGTGVVIGGLGVWALTQAESSGEKVGSGLITTFGVLYAGWGTYQLLTPSKLELVDDEFRKLPSTNNEQIERKVIWGETRLESISNEAKRNRVRGGWTNIVLGGALTALYATDTSRSAESKRFPIIIFGGVFPALGISALFSESTEEETYRGYLEKTRSNTQSTVFLSNAKFSLAPTLDKGVAAQATFSF